MAQLPTIYNIQASDASRHIGPVDVINGAGRLQKIQQPVPASIPTKGAEYLKIAGIVIGLALVFYIFKGLLGGDNAPPSDEDIVIVDEENDEPETEELIDPYQAEKEALAQQFNLLLEDIDKVLDELWTKIEGAGEKGRKELEETASDLIKKRSDLEQAWSDLVDATQEEAWEEAKAVFENMTVEIQAHLDWLKKWLDEWEESDEGDEEETIYSY